MTAREMFENLWYTKHVSDNCIVYENGNYIMRDIIEFHLKDRIVYLCTKYEAGNAIKGLTVNEFKAIQQQLKELGWI